MLSQSEQLNPFLDERRRFRQLLLRATTVPVDAIDLNTKAEFTQIDVALEAGNLFSPKYVVK